MTFSCYSFSGVALNELLAAGSLLLLSSHVNGCFESSVDMTLKLERKYLIIEGEKEMETVSYAVLVVAVIVALVNGSLARDFGQIAQNPWTFLL